jgi:hypothetical protein
VDVLRSALAVLVGGPSARCDHFDVETYTWSVLPVAQRPASPAELAGSIAAELRFARTELLALSLAAAPPPGPGRPAQPVPAPPAAEVR